MTPLDAWILGMVEGITEYLPVSSTGHLILTSWLLGLDRTPEQAEAVKDFEIIIQGGAILAVLGIYRARVRQMALGTIARTGLVRLGDEASMKTGWTIARNVIIAFLPAVVIGLLAKDWIKATLFSPAPVIGALVVGGLVMLAMSPWQARRLREERAAIDAASAPMVASGWRDVTGAALARMTARQALLIGLMQCLAMWPGTSRSFATILGGLLVGLGGVAAAEFSFLLGLVTLSAASAYSALKIVKAGEGAQFIAQIGGWLPLVCGILVAWASAALAVDFLVRYLGRHTLAVFGWWRLAVAAAALVAAWRFGLTIAP
ncbi:MAG: undecaprenyl-diphosphatase [Planctomycetota bacterium]